MKTTQLAINAISTRHRDLEEALDAYAGAGFRAVELFIPQLKEWLGRGHTMAEARGQFTARDLRCIGGFETHLACFAPVETRRANHELHLGNARLIDELGGGTLVVGTDGPEAPFADPLAALDPIAEAFHEMARRLEGLDVRIALEFNWSPVVKSLQSAVRVAKQVDDPRIGVLFDPAHYYVTPTKFSDLTAESVARILHVHLDDMRDKPGDLSHCNSDRVLPGQGILDLPALIGRLEELGYQGMFSIEMFNADLWALPADQAARLCYESLLPLCS
jgi:4-hydroxyphenylpyruvate dioxygenase